MKYSSHGESGRWSITTKIGKSARKKEWSGTGMKRLTNEEFIVKARLVHGEKYDYSQTKYVGTYENIDIVCLEHGKYSQIAHNHLVGKGCPHCAGNIQSTTSKFIAKAHLVHFDLYDYSNVNYKNNFTKVNIKCKEHGIFKQSPSQHLLGNGCPTCSNNVKSTTDQFIDEARKIHRNKYDYSLCTYKGAHTKVSIICKTHGTFTQTPRNHLNGQNCPKCTYRISKNETEFLDIINISDENRQKRICRYNIDGYDPKTNTIYEFLGNYWHGNPRMFISSDINAHCKKSFGELYRNTIHKFQVLKTNGYCVKFIWENDWNTWNKIGEIPLQEF